MARGAVVYRFYNNRADLLYVGATIQWDKRHDVHRRTAPWFHEVADHSLNHFETLEEAREFETALIATCEPRYNRAPGGAGRPATDPATHRSRLVVTLSPEALALVAALRAETGLTQSAVVELALRRLAGREGGR